MGEMEININLSKLEIDKILNSDVDEETKEKFIEALNKAKGSEEASHLSKGFQTFLIGAIRTNLWKMGKELNRLVTYSDHEEIKKEAEYTLENIEKYVKSNGGDEVG